MHDVVLVLRSRPGRATPACRSPRSEMSRMRKRSPTGSSPRNRFCWTVEPMMQTALPACSSASVQIRPSVERPLLGGEELRGRAVDRASANWPRCAPRGPTTAPAARPRGRRRPAPRSPRRRPCRNRAPAARRRRGRSPGRGGSGGCWRRGSKSAAATAAVAPLPERHHRHHRGDADDDAEHGQERAQQVPPDLADGEDDGGEEHRRLPVAPAEGPHRSTTLMGPKAGVSLRRAVTFRPGIPAFAGMTNIGHAATPFSTVSTSPSRKWTMVRA